MRGGAYLSYPPELKFTQTFRGTKFDKVIREFSKTRDVKDAKKEITISGKWDMRNLRPLFAELDQSIELEVKGKKVRSVENRKYYFTWK